MTDVIPEVTISSQEAFSGRLLHVRVDSVLLANGKTATREVVAHPGAVAMVPVLSDGRLALVRQWRHAVGRALLEIPAGTLEPGEPPETSAARELMEEVGYRPGRLTLLASVLVAPGYSSELIHLYLAEELTPERLAHDEDEALHCAVITWEEAEARITSGEIVDAKTICGLALARKVLDSRKADSART